LAAKIILEGRPDPVDITARSEGFFAPHLVYASTSVEPRFVLHSAVTDATGMLAPIAVFVMISTSRSTINPSISFKPLFGIEHTNAVRACTLHQINR
jgi:hypothetical protein